MMVTGIGLTSVASLAFIGGGALLIGTAASDAGDVTPVSIIFGVPLVIGSVLFAAPGIPLWVIGAGKAPPKNAVPAVSVGAGSATLRWTF
jgi:hypothetical protein